MTIPASVDHNIAICVEGISKVYKLYDSPLDRMKESLHPLRKKYHKDFHALDNVSFSIHKGESVGIIGQNGSGKSTLLKIITGVLTPSAGNVYVNGRVSALLELGAGFNPELSGLENVYFNGTLMGYTRNEMNEKVDGILTFADIGDFIHQPVKTYSSGMFVRLAFAVASNVSPDVLIVDEALSVGDARFQGRCFDKIKAMRNDGVTILHVSHAIQTFQNTCDVGILLDGGRVYMKGEPKNVSITYHRLLREKEESYQEMLRQKVKAEGAKSEERKTLKQQQPTIHDEKRFGDKGAEIEAFRVYNDSDNETLVLESGKLFRIEVDVAFHSKVENPAVGVMIRSPQGMNLLGIHTYCSLDLDLGVKNKGDRISLSFNSQMALNPGNYLLNIGVADHITVHDYRSLDSRNHIAPITVIGEGVPYGLVNHAGSVAVISDSKGD